MGVSLIAAKAQAQLFNLSRVLGGGLGGQQALVCSHLRSVGCVQSLFTITELPRSSGPGEDADQPRLQTKLMLVDLTL